MVKKVSAEKGLSMPKSKPPVGEASLLLFDLSLRLARSSF
jgi:hypothetical protein